jgi:hypothetical protein
VAHTPEVEEEQPTVRFDNVEQAQPGGGLDRRRTSASSTISNGGDDGCCDDDACRGHLANANFFLPAGLRASNFFYHRE